MPTVGLMRGEYRCIVLVDPADKSSWQWNRASSERMRRAGMSEFQVIGSQLRKRQMSCVPSIVWVWQDPRQQPPPREP